MKTVLIQMFLAVFLILVFSNTSAENNEMMVALELENEMEIKLNVEGWMLNAVLWSTNLYEIDFDQNLMLEDWMTNGNNWFRFDLAISDEEDCRLDIEDWMVKNFKTEYLVAKNEEMF